MRFSGHESFACRYAWLPKAYRALARDPAALADDEAAMVELGVGKNMVRSIRFWVEVTGVAVSQAGRAFALTPFARAIFADEGFDPYLENVRTLWLLHWHLSSRARDPLFAWDFLLSRWPYPELTRTEALAAFARESRRLGHAHSPVTLAQHFDVFLHSYVPSRPAAVAEDSLDGPLVELALLQQAGERRAGPTGHREPVYLFRREPKPEISVAVFEFCLDDYWHQWHPDEATLTFRDVAVAEGSLGQVFKLPEDDVRARLEVYAAAAEAAPFVYQPSAVQGLVTRRETGGRDFLAAVYEPGGDHA